MKNKIVGILIIGIAILMGFIIYSFNISLNKIATSSCSDVISGLSCPIAESSNFQTKISLGVTIFLLLVGFYLIFFAKEEKIVTKVIKVKEQIKPKEITIENFKEIMKDFDDEEKNVFEKIIEAKGSILQSELVNTTGLDKVKITRILDKLEGRGLLERKRRGMTNVVILKN